MSADDEHAVQLSRTWRGQAACELAILVTPPNELLQVSTHSPLIEFSSTAFAVEPDEDAETGPGIYGHALASFVAGALAARGWDARECYPDEVGWLVPVAAGSYHMYVACRNLTVEADHWQVFSFVDTGVFGGMSRDAVRAAELARLHHAVAGLLSEAAQVRDLRVLDE